MRQLQRALSLIYPPQCPLCETLLDEVGGLCGACWRDTPFLKGLVCDACGTSLPGDADEAIYCDDCLVLPRPWDRGRAALAYRDQGRRIALSLKHGDRLDLVPLAASWMSEAGQDVLAPETVLVPIPIHWTRLLSRRYNQAAELSRGLAKITGLSHCADALLRNRRTPKQDGMSVDQRFANMAGAISPNPKWRDLLDGMSVCLVDDVMTSGATLAVATEALREMGADHVSVLVLARVEKAP
jgi:ComF family protein